MGGLSENTRVSRLSWDGESNAVIKEVGQLPQEFRHIIFSLFLSNSLVLPPGYVLARSSMPDAPPPSQNQTHQPGNLPSL